MIEARVLTFNTLYKGDARERIRALAAALEQSDHDVVCLQEMWIPQNLALLRSLTPSYRHAAHGLRYPIVAGGLVVLSRHPIIGYRYVRYAARGPLRKELLSRKGVLVTRLSIDDRILTVVNTHLSANTKANWSRTEPFTKVQAAELRDAATLVRSLDAGEPVVMVGDFNVPRESWLFADFVAASGLVDALDGSPETTYRPNGNWPGAALDQILVSPGVSADPRLVFQDDVVQLADGRTTYLSDHYGIAATIRTAKP